MALLNFSLTFDVSHSVLLNNLRCIGVSDFVLDWIICFLFRCVFLIHLSHVAAEIACHWKICADNLKSNL